MSLWRDLIKPKTFILIRQWLGNSNYGRYYDQISDKITTLSRASIWNLDGDKLPNRVAGKSIKLKIILARK